MKKEFILTYLILKIQNEQYGFNKKLPSIRFLAQKFNVSNRTVQIIYDELKKLGLVKSVDRVGYVCNESYIYNLWRTRNEYATDNEKLIVKKASNKLKDKLNLQGDWIMKYLESDSQKQNWISLSIFNFAFEIEDINLPLKKIFSNYGKAITSVKIKIKGLSIKKNSVFKKYFLSWDKGIICEEISFYSFDTLIAKLIFYQPNNKFFKVITFSVL